MLKNSIEEALYKLLCHMIKKVSRVVSIYKGSFKNMEYNLKINKILQALRATKTAVDLLLQRCDFSVNDLTKRIPMQFLGPRPNGSQVDVLNDLLLRNLQYCNNLSYTFHELFVDFLLQSVLHVPMFGKQPSRESQGRTRSFEAGQQKDVNIADYDIIGHLPWLCDEKNSKIFGLKDWTKVVKKTVNDYFVTLASIIQ
uniref:Uncharacterized protein n=1 Tax=Romanomermis culicivorax TaxID=13658 RepID=A0A915I6Q2_ROMCU